MRALLCLENTWKHEENLKKILSSFRSVSHNVSGFPVILWVTMSFTILERGYIWHLRLLWWSSSTEIWGNRGIDTNISIFLISLGSNAEISVYIKKGEKGGNKAEPKVPHRTFNNIHFIIVDFRTDIIFRKK